MNSALAHDAPIGVFDSGIGGLTVVAELMRQLPAESIVYFGDTARLPYGPKSPQTVLRYSREIAAILLGRGVKAIVIACNTASAHALEALRAECPVPVVGVIEPGARAAVAVTPRGVIGVIGTRGTIASQAYSRAIAALSDGATVLGVPCPLFVPLVEEGLTEGPAAEIIARDYLRTLSSAGVSSLVLGCTHYPLLKPLLQQVMGAGVTLIDSAAETASEVGRALSAAHLLAPAGSHPSYTFMASDDPEQFSTLGARFLGLPIDDVEVVPAG